MTFKVVDSCVSVVSSVCRFSSFLNLKCVDLAFSDFYVFGWVKIKQRYELLSETGEVGLRGAFEAIPAYAVCPL